ncbi:hypothetical protein NKH70_11775 [Mesorhizobium sp. M0991]|uniref:hypothetical protein n=1 Tax=Mesorhizobium sp. M0991 TaxID=2957043 RepID=UPI003336AB2B
MSILLITIPPLIVYLFFNRQIVAGMTAGAVDPCPLWAKPGHHVAQAEQLL